MNNSPSDDPRNMLPQHVDYEFVAKRFCVHRRTIERRVRAGTFPKPIAISPNRVGWELNVVLDWYNENIRGVMAEASANPNELDADELIAAARELIVQAHSKQQGSPIDPKTIGSITVSRSITEEEFRNAEAREFAIHAERFKNISTSRSITLAAWLFPALRPYFGFEDERFNYILHDADLLARVGPLALYEDTWFENQEDLIASLDERERKQSTEPSH